MSTKPGQASDVSNGSTSMPDIANEVTTGITGPLDWVGMGQIEMPVMLALTEGVAPTSAGRVGAYVNLERPDVRGIHMSRLYLLVDQVLGRDALRPVTVHKLLQGFLESHRDLSSAARVRIDFELLARRSALRSDNSGWRSYPVSVMGCLRNGVVELEMACEVTYSSTCPCSAALARQLIQQRFQQTFGADRPLDYQSVVDFLGSEQGLCATPHSQRSGAQLRVRINPELEVFPFLSVIDRVEQALATPVQTAVKREDEQAFAQLNGENLMFCEDAGRRIKQALDNDGDLVDFWARATHYESLHAHDAVAVVTKGIAGGFDADG